MSLIAPSVLGADFSCFGKEIQNLEHAGADWIHWDVMDGQYVPNLTFGPGVIKALRPFTQLPFDVHLMVHTPENLFTSLKDAGTDRITIHPEACPHIHKSLNTLQDLGIKKGVALNPGTPLCLIEPLLPYLDHVLVMTVNPGFGGQTFIREMLKKIKDVKTLIGSRNILIQVDGGITCKTAPDAWQAGADCLVAGSSILQTSDYKDSIHSLKASIL